MTTVSVTAFALHIQNYLDQVMQGEKIRIHLQNEQFTFDESLAQAINSTK